MTEKRIGVAVLAEVVAVLARYPALRVSPIVDSDVDVVTITITTAVDGLDVLALVDELKYVSNVAQIRYLASQYSIDTAKLEAFLPALQEDAPVGALRCITVEEIEAIIAVISESDIPQHAMAEYVNAAIPKLQVLARAMSGTISAPAASFPDDFTPSGFGYSDTTPRRRSEAEE